MDEKIIPLAALLHDVGKFWQGAGGKGKHAELSGNFIQSHVPWEGVLGLVSSHHDPSKHRYIGRLIFISNGFGMWKDDK